MGRGPARPVKYSFGWHAARPGPLTFQRMGRGPTRPITFSIFPDPAWPGPSHFQNPRPGPARPITLATRPMRPGLYTGRPAIYVGRPVDLTSRGRPMCFPVLDSLGQLVPADEAHTPSKQTHTILLHQQPGPMASVPTNEPPPSPAAAMPAAAAAAAAAAPTCCCNTCYRSVLRREQRYRALPFGACYFPCYSSSPHSRFDKDIHTYQVFTGGPNQGKNVKRWLGRGGGEEYPLYTHNGTKAFIRFVFTRTTNQNTEQ